MNQEAYKEALKQYNIHNKAEQLKQYAVAVQQGNKKAVDKAKLTKHQQKKKKKQNLQEEARPESAQPAKPRMS